MMNEKEREVLRRLEKEYATIRNDVKAHLSKEMWLGVKGGMAIAAWECFKAFETDMSEEFVEELQKFRSEI